MPGWLHWLRAVRHWDLDAGVACVVIGVLMLINGRRLGDWLNRVVPRRTPAAARALREQMRHRKPDDEQPAAPADPVDDEPAPAREPEPVNHQGATLAWADDLRALARTEAHLRDGADVDVVDVLHDVDEREARIAEFANQPVEWGGTEYTADLARLDNAVGRVDAICQAEDPHRAYLVWRGMEHTAQWSTAELHALLDAETARP